MNPKTRKRLGLGCLGLFVGSVLGGAIGVFSSYALAALITDGREQQAYLTVLLVPAVALLGP